MATMLEIFIVIIVGIVSESGTVWAVVIVRLAQGTVERVFGRSLRSVLSRHMALGRVAGPDTPSHQVVVVFVERSGR